METASSVAIILGFVEVMQESLFLVCASKCSCAVPGICNLSHLKFRLLEYVFDLLTN